MSDTIHRRRSISMLMLMALLVSFVLPFAATPARPTAAAPASVLRGGVQSQASRNFGSPVVDGVVDTVYGAPLATDPANDGQANLQNLDYLNLYVADDETSFYFAMELNANLATANWGKYMLAIDTTNDGVGATTNAWGRNVAYAGQHKPEYAIHSWADAATYGPGNTQLQAWNGSAWSQTGATTAAALGVGATSIIEWQVAKADLGNPQRIWVEAWNTGGGDTDNAQDTIPDDWNATDWSTQAVIDRFVMYGPPIVDGVVDTVYGAPLATDPANDGQANLQNLDYLNLYVTDDATSFYFAMELNANLATTNWGKYMLAIDTSNDGAGADTNAWGRNVVYAGQHKPEYAIHSWADVATYGITNTQLFAWNGAGWDQTGATSAAALGAGTTSIIEWKVAKADLGDPNTIWVEAWNTGGGGTDNAQDTIPDDWNATDWAAQAVIDNFIQYEARYPIQEDLPAEVGDGLINKAAIRHDSRDSLYKVPFGAITLGTSATLRLRTAAHDVESVKVRLYNTADNSQSIKALTKVATDAAGGYDYWEYLLPAHAEIGVVYYRFIIADGATTVYYEDDNRYDGGLGETVNSSSDRSWNIYIYEPDFDTPEWAKNAVIYQIFVERFRNGDPTNDPTANPADVYPGETTPTRGWFYPDERGHRFPITPWNTIVPDPEPYTDPSREYWATYSSTMYGGDLKGVQDKLDYLQSLGVTTLYLNPIFDSPSNHKYDGRNYRTVDPAFGGPDDFAALATAAHARGMYLVLDGVPNHVSSDSPYFDRFGRHPGSGACESQNSPYRSWFFFQEVPAGTGRCVSDSGVVNGANYTGWFGVLSLPQINTAHPEVMAYWFGTPGGDPNLPSNTASYWVTGDDKADGWRIDVVPDVVGVNPTFFETWRDTMKAANPEAVLYSETWPEDVVRDRVLGDEFDSTMNYRYRKAVLGFLRDTRWTDNDGGQEVDPLSPSQFVNAFTTMQEDYPKPAFDAAMNLIDSHDTNRAVHVLNEQGFTGTGYNRQPVDGFADARKRLGMVAVLQMTLPGAPTIYYGDEVGLTGFGFDVPRDDPYNRQPYPWDDAAGYAALPDWRKADNALLAHYQSLGQLRGDHSFLRTGSFDPLLTDDANKVLAYGRKDATGAAIVVMNRDDEAHTVELDLKTYVPVGVTLNKVLPDTGTAVPGLTTYQFVVPANSYGIWVTPANANMSVLAAPTNLAITQELSQSVRLQWTAVANASSYNVYRSLVSGGGYELVGSPTGTTFTDTSVTTGARAYYVVKAVGANGFESAASNEVMAVPSLAITNAIIVTPAQMVHTIGITPTQPFTARITVPGLTNVAGDESLITAEIGYGPLGSNPETWTKWWPMSHDAACANCAGAYQFTGRVRPESLGTFGVLVRFSTNAGYTWTYGDLNGPAVGTYRVYLPFLAKTGAGAQAAAAPLDVPSRQYDSPAILTVIASSDTTPPAAPANLRATTWSADYIALAWNAVPGAAEYWLYRRAAGSGYGEPLERLTAPTTVYTDTAVTTGITYTYAVRAVDPALNRSALSNEVSQQAALRMATVTFRVRVPDATPDGDTVYIAGNSAEAFGQQWNPGAQPMTEVAPNVWEYSVQLIEGTELQYKYTRGAWERVEWWGEIVSVSNRTVTTGYGPGGVFLIDNTATDWGTGPDSTKAVRWWRDPVVDSVTPANGGTFGGTVSASWLQPVEATTTENAILTVTKGNTPVAGTVARVDADTFGWTPAAALTPGTYTVTAFNVKRSDIGGEAVPQAQPYTWTFTVQ